MPAGAAKENSPAAKGPEYRSRLFEAEREPEETPDKEREAERRLRAGPIVEEYYGWPEKIPDPTGKLKKAILCSRSRREYLGLFPDHGKARIRSNQAENAIRPTAAGRKDRLVL